MEKKIFNLIKKNCKVIYGDGRRFFGESPKGLLYMYDLPVPKGTYSSKALDYLLVDPKADISSFLVDTDILAVEEPAKGEEIDLPKEVIEAAKFVSKDDTRPVLNYVHLFSGDLLATDGYRAYIERTEITKDFYLLPNMIAAMKVLGTTVYLSSDNVSLFSAGFLISQPLEDLAVPDLRSLMAGQKFLYKVTIPYKELKQLIDKKDSHLTISEDGTLSLPSRILPVTATVEKLEDFSGEFPKILMPLIGKGGIVSFDFSLLAPTENLYITDKWIYY